jgi:O-antigen chain-terminating methyltransferase
VAHEKEPPALQPLRTRLEDEEVAYADALAALDRLAALLRPEEPTPDMRADLGEVNTLWSAPLPPSGGGLGDAVRRRAWTALSPVTMRQERFNAALVRLINAHLDRTARLDARLGDLAGALVHYAQRIEPVMDARDLMSVAAAPTRADLALAALDRKAESMGQRLDGLSALRDRLEVLSEEVRALRRSLEGTAPAPEVAPAAARAVADSVYFRGSREEIRARQTDYAARFRDLSPVVDLGCGRGEFLDLVRAQGTEARGVEGNANAVQECRERGLDVIHGDLVEFLRGQGTSSLGGVFAAQVVEHLPPPTLTGLLSDAHRALRPGGLLVLETVNPASALAFLDHFIRDLTHERPLHPETLRFLAAAAGFSDVRVEMRSPVPDEARLRPVPAPGLPRPAIEALNENVARLNALLFAPLDYALLARR